MILSLRMHFLRNRYLWALIEYWCHFIKSQYHLLGCVSIVSFSLDAELSPHEVLKTVLKLSKNSKLGSVM